VVAEAAVDGKVVICSLNGRQPLLRGRSISADTRRRGARGEGAHTAGSRHLDFTPLFYDDKIQDVGGRGSGTENRLPRFIPPHHGFSLQRICFFFSVLHLVPVYEYNIYTLHPYTATYYIRA